MDERTEYRTVDLERMKLVVLQHVSTELAEQFAIAPEVAVSSWMGEEIALRIVQQVYGRECARKEASYPADWWQAFKDRWFPDWAKRRWPVEVKTIRLVARELYPMVAMPHHNVQIALTSTAWTEYKN